ncbi:NAD(P)/FAD-dependent oxidoreductase [Desulfotalea psychrophila]|uniref:Related to dehydrogenases (Flavoproteins) n=1 Tax=Desulfotalea psychrophila (strain LSv54 / DSM 12343) TaxID=177439 RepID=Q6ALA8_DESPS|nr:NAD(P)/FAD-dependent oxidoreductase [Desulfotalea psychrophila]CAG36867.1 related to dehydrogenases (flavoproteins) [Desulfotalea psychrophila LSv54]
MEFFDIVIIGAGPAGLACAKEAGKRGYSVLVLERNGQIGRKVCAGGITWNGLMRHMPGFATERDFAKQHLFSRYQSCCIEADHPIVATLNREHLGRSMAEQAQEAGAVIRTEEQALQIGAEKITVRERKTGRDYSVAFKYLVGADGSSSLVRRYLGQPVKHIGLGLNFQIRGRAEKMEWHLRPDLFVNGYAWIFPHQNTISIGAYADRSIFSPTELKRRFLVWAKAQGYGLEQERCTAGYINYDYRGYRFGSDNNIFLTGDAAGLASGLTGEGIYPAIVSGIAVAEEIAGCKDHPELEAVIKSQRMQRRILDISGRGQVLATLLSEAMTLGMRSKILKFDTVEMAGTSSIKK